MSFNSESALKACEARKIKKQEIQRQNHLQTLPALNQLYLNNYEKLKIKFMNFLQATFILTIWEQTMQFCKEKYCILFDHIINNMRITSNSKGNLI